MHQLISHAPKPKLFHGSINFEHPNSFCALRFLHVTQQATHSKTQKRTHMPLSKHIWKMISFVQIFFILQMMPNRAKLRTLIWRIFFGNVIIYIALLN